MKILENINFIGGTLVEYQMGSDYIEWERGEVAYFRSVDDTITIETVDSIKYNGLDKLGHVHLYSTNATLTDVRNGIYYIFGGPYLNIYYALAPKGVEIAKQDNYFGH